MKIHSSVTTCTALLLVSAKVLFSCEAFQPLSSSSSSSSASRSSLSFVSPGALPTPASTAVQSPLFRAPTTPSHGDAIIRHSVSAKHDVEARQRLPRHEAFWATISQQFKRSWTMIRRRVMTLGLALALVFSTHVGIAQAVSGGRSGGSFSPSSSRSSSAPSMSRPNPYSSSSTWGRSRMPNVLILNSGPRYQPIHTWGSSSAAVSSPTRLAPAELAVLTTVGAVMVYGMVNNQNRLRRENAGPLGPGATMASVTVALNVPDQDDPNSVVKTLRKLSLRADTSQRKGVQNLLSDVALELLRREQSIVSASTESRHFSEADLAQRAFQAKSIRSRSKFDRETVNKFGDRRVQDDAAMRNTATNGPRATKAVVTLNLAIEGDSTVLPSIKSRSDLMNILSKIASDSQVGDCLLSGEILWAPDAPGETITNDDLYVDYPELLPL